MKATLLLAESATVHPDGTFSVLRAGITHIWGTPSPVVPFRGALVFRIEATAVDEGQHEFDLRCIDIDGTQVGPTLQGQFQAPKGGGVNNVILNTSLGFPKHGRFSFVARIDKVERDQWTLVVGDKPPQRREETKA